MKKIILAVVLLLSATANATTTYYAPNVHKVSAQGHLNYDDGLVSAEVYNKSC
jgi:hypothetical protein